MVVKNIILYYLEFYYYKNFEKLLLCTFVLLLLSERRQKSWTSSVVLSSPLELEVGFPFLPPTNPACKGNKRALYPSTRENYLIGGIITENGGLS